MLTVNWRRAGDCSLRYNTIILGAGPAGLSSAIQLARYNHSVLVFDGGDGRAGWVPKFHNYLGFPQGISGKDLLRLGREQAQKYGAEIVKSQVVKIEKKEEEDFIVTTSSAEYRSRRLIFATGLEDLQPEFPNRYDFAGRSLFYCLDCNGYDFNGQKAVVLGNTQGTIKSALDLLVFTHQVFIATNGAPLDDFEKFKNVLVEYKIDVITEPIDRFLGKAGAKGKMEAIAFKNGKTKSVDVALSTYGTKANSQLAQGLKVETNGSGHIIVNDSMETNIPHVYAVGDVANTTQMLVLAVSEGVKAAMSIHDSLQPNRR